MDLWIAPVVDLRPSMPRERAQLLDLLAGLDDEKWQHPSVATDWTVKGLALHLLDDDLGWLSRGRDGDNSGRLGPGETGGFVAALDAKNQRWIDGAEGLSRPVVIGLLEWVGAQMDDYYADVDLMGEGRVAWASDGPIPQWFDIAQDFTERWVHQMQIRETLDRVEGYRDEWLPEVMATLMWAVPHQFRAAATGPACIGIDVASAGTWSLTSTSDGRWDLSTEAPNRTDASLTLAADAGWHWLTGAPVTADDYEWDGPEDLLDALLVVRGILA